MASQTGSLQAGFAPAVGHELGFEVEDLVCIILMQRTNGGGDVADEINSFAALAAAAIER